MSADQVAGARRVPGFSFPDPESSAAAVVIFSEWVAVAKKEAVYLLLPDVATVYRSRSMHHPLHVVRSLLNLGGGTGYCVTLGRDDPQKLKSTSLELALTRKPSPRRRGGDRVVVAHQPSPPLDNCLLCCRHVCRSCRCPRDRPCHSPPSCCCRRCRCRWRCRPCLLFLLLLPLGAPFGYPRGWQSRRRRCRCRRQPPIEKKIPCHRHRRRCCGVLGHPFLLLLLRRPANHAAARCPPPSRRGAAAAATGLAGRSARSAPGERRSETRELWE